MILLFKIIIDSACDLPKKIIEKFDIDILPFKIYIDNREYKDGININTKDVYKSMRNGKFPRTAQVSPTTFNKTFTNYARKGTSCLYIAFSSQLSGTFQTGIMVAKKVKKQFPDFDINIIDSKCGSTAIGLAAKKAAEMIESGHSKTDIIETVKFYTQHLEHIFTLDNLKYLQHGGRINKTKAFIGNILNIKPILNLQNGKICLLKKVRGKKRVLDNIMKIMATRSKNIPGQTIGISHADDKELALKIKEMIKEKFEYNDFIINLVGSVLGVHLGIGGVGIFFLNKKPSN